MSMSAFRGSRRALIPALGLTLLLLAASLPLADAPVAAAESEAPLADADATSLEAIICASSFDQVENKVGMSLHGVTLLERGALAVGYTRNREDDDFGRRKPATVVNRRGIWSRVFTRSPGNEDGLMAVTTRADAGTWAVGWTTIDGLIMPLALRWTGNGWSVDRPVPRGSLPSVFTDVTIVGDGSPFAVGFRMTASGKRQPLVIRKDGPRWRSIPINVGRRESITLTGVTPDRTGSTWVVGHGGPGAEIKPVVYLRKNGSWKRIPTPRLSGEAALTDVVATGARDSWAVGYHRYDGVSDPLVLRWDGRRWRAVAAPDFGSRDVLLTAVTEDPTGGVWVVGAAWNEERKSYEAVAAWWDGQGWNEYTGVAGGTELNDVIGSLDRDGWAVGRAGDSARATRVCTPLQSGVFGGAQPGGDDGPLPSPPADPQGEAEPADLPLPGGASDPSMAGSDAGAGAPAAAPAAAAERPLTEGDAAAAETAVTVAKSGGHRSKAKKEHATKARKAARRAVKGSRSGPLPKARADRAVVARDVARQAGIFDDTGTYGAVVEDFDADGADDLFIGRHGRKGLLLLNRDGSFIGHPALELAPIDRHGCTAADIDGSGLPDLYCTVGGKRGSGLKSNELWLDPAGPAPTEVAAIRGVSDPTGRGRYAAFLETEGQPGASLVVTNSPVRVDGLPSSGRLFRTSGDGRFAIRARPGFAPRLGALALQDADLDGDGREDLLLVTGGAQAPRQAGSHLYRNTSRGLVDVTRRMGVRSIGEVDAELADLDKDGRLDLVQLSPTRLRVSTLERGRFRKVYEGRLSQGRAVAVGDANGDGRGDIYVVRSNGGRNVPDVMLLNRGGGRRWSAVTIPQVSRGDGEDAYAIDHDGNGLDDFVVLNGHNRRGPIQLIAFYPR